MASKVYTMDRRSHSTETGFVAQMLTLFDEANFEQLVKPGDVVAIKVHCGEWNNTAYLRPVYARAVATGSRSWAAGRLCAIRPRLPTVRGPRDPSRRT